MKMRFIILMLVVSFVLALFGLSTSLAHGHSPQQPTISQTRVFQQGLNGYTGASDTWISSLTWDHPPQYLVNYGQNNILRLSRDGSENPLLRFDLTGIPGNSAVISASMSLYNLTPSACSLNGNLPRRAKVFGILTGWDEGNEVQAVVTATVGAHGATGDYAFLYYSGGVNAPWGERGMAAGTDYADHAESYADVVNPGWYTWDVTALVRAWVRQEQPNYGLTLRDASSYQDGNCDWRDFASAQYSSVSSLRPKITILYNPDVPYADAGSDMTNLTWIGSAVMLDGSASHDRPGGNEDSLVYAWRIAQAAYGSALSGEIGAMKTISFTPDVAGEWNITLRVTNDLGESAEDTVSLRVLNIPSGHPRVYLTPAKLAALRARALPSNPRWTQLLSQADDPSGDMQAKALVSQVTGQAIYCNQAVALALSQAADPSDWATKAGDIALVYDWCYAQLSSSQRNSLVNYFNAWGDAAPKGEDLPGWGN